MSVRPNTDRTKQDHAPNFEDLPPEIRNEIYSMALTLPDLIEMEKGYSKEDAALFHQYEDLLRTADHTRAKALLQEVKWGRPYRIDGDLKIYDENYRTIHTPEARARLSSQLLAVSTTIHAEATSILYGTNRFHMLDSIDRCQFGKFVEKIGASIKHIRHIKIDISSEHRNNVRDFANQISAATSLRTFDFHSLKRGKAVSSPKSMAAVLRLPAARMIKVRASSEDGKHASPGEVAAIFRFSGRSKIEASEYTAQVQAALEKLLRQQVKPPRKAKKYP